METTKEQEMTAEEFFRSKIRELNPNSAVITLSNELITGEQGLRWAHEYALQMVADKERRIKELQDALESAKNGLEWFINEYHGGYDNSDHEMMDTINEALKPKDK